MGQHLPLMSMDEARKALGMVWAKRLAVRPKEVVVAEAHCAEPSTGLDNCRALHIREPSWKLTALRSRPIRRLSVSSPSRTGSRQSMTRSGAHGCARRSDAPRPLSKRRLPHQLSEVVLRVSQVTIVLKKCHPPPGFVQHGPTAFVTLAHSTSSIARRAGQAQGRRGVPAGSRLGPSAAGAESRRVERGVPWNQSCVTS